LLTRLLIIYLDESDIVLQRNWIELRE
jgi:hypothetical protein